MPPCGPVGKPDYDKCEWTAVRLDVDNGIIWDVYRRIFGQVNWAGNLDVSVAYQTMDRLAIPWNDQLGLFKLFDLSQPDKICWI